MTASVAIFPPNFRITGPTGAVASGARIRFFEAGTSTPKPVFSDQGLTQSLGSIVYTRSDGYPVASEGSNTTVNVYIGPGLYKYDVLDAAGALICPAKDNVPGAVATTDEGTPEVTSPVVTITGTSNPIDATFNGKFVIGNTAGGNVAATLAAASVLGDGFHCRFKKSAAANTMTIALAGGSDLIDGASTAVLLGELLAQAEQDGTAFEVLECEQKAQWFSRLKATALPPGAENANSLHVADNFQEEVAARIIGKLK